MTWLRPVDRTSGTLTLNAGTLSCLVHHGTLLSERCPTTTALERTTVPMDDAVLFDAIHRGRGDPNLDRRSVVARVSSYLARYRPQDRGLGSASTCGVLPQEFLLCRVPTPFFASSARTRWRRLAPA
jgi:hypothetical protein